MSDTTTSPLARFVGECSSLAERVRAARQWRKQVCLACTPMSAEKCPFENIHRVQDSTTAATN